MTIDQRMRYQQNMRQLSIGIVVIEVRDTRFIFLQALLPQLREAMTRVERGEVIVVTG